MPTDACIPLHCKPPQRSCEHCGGQGVLLVGGATGAGACAGAAAPVRAAPPRNQQQGQLKQEQGPLDLEAIEAKQRGYREVGQVLH